MFVLAGVASVMVVGGGLVAWLGSSSRDPGVAATAPSEQHVATPPPVSSTIVPEPSAATSTEPTPEPSASATTPLPTTPTKAPVVTPATAPNKTKKRNVGY
jgi:hypothetical protein